MASNIPITNGQGQSSVAAEEIGSLKYQQIKVIGGQTGSTSVWGINPDGSAQVSVVGTITATLTGTPSISGAVTVVGNPSISGTVGASVIGWVPVQLSNTSVITVSQSSSVIAVATGSVVAIPTGNQSVSGALFISGSVLSQQTGTVISSIVNTVPSSVIVGASIFGQLPAGTAPLGSVATLQGTTPWISTNVGSIITTNIGSVITVLQAASIAGTYAEDTTYTAGDRGLFGLYMRNDTLASITSADLEYSGAAVGPVGELVVANSPLTKWVQGTADFRQGNAGASILVVANGVASIFQYITGVQVANMGPASVLVTLASGGSTLGYTIAPAGGGSNIYYPNGLKTPGSFGMAASISGIASVLVSAQGFVSKV